MATKPSATVIWATNGLYTVGPAIGNNTKEPLAGSATEGFVPGTGIAAEFVNAVFNELGEWSVWSLAGTFLATLDAHVIETDSGGATNIASFQIGGTASGSFAARFVENSGADSTTILAINAVGNDCITALVTGGTGSAILASSSGSGAAVSGTNTDTGDGGTFTGGTTSGDGVRGICVGASGSGVRGISSALGGGEGVDGAVQSFDANGVRGVNFIAGADAEDADHAAVRGLGLDSTAGYFVSTNGYGVWAQSDTGVLPSRAALHLEPQATDPVGVNLTEGDVWYNSGEDQLKAFARGAPMGVWTTLHGYLYAYAEAVAEVDGGTSTDFSVVVATTTFAPSQEPVQSFATATITVCFEFGSSGGGFQWRVEDTTAVAYPFDNGGLPVDGRVEVVHIASGAADDRYLSQKVQYTIPASGPRSFELQIRSVDGFETSFIRRASIEITGSHG